MFILFSQEARCSPSKSRAKIDSEASMNGEDRDDAQRMKHFETIFSYSLRYKSVARLNTAFECMLINRVANRKKSQKNNLKTCLHHREAFATEPSQAHKSRRRTTL